MLHVETRAVQSCETERDSDSIDTNLYALKGMAFVANQKYIQICEDPKRAISQMWMGRFPYVWQKVVDGLPGAGAEFIRNSRDLLVTSSSEPAFFSVLPRLCFAAEDAELHECARALAIASAVLIMQAKDHVGVPKDPKACISHACEEYGLDSRWDKTENWDDAVVEPDFWMSLIRTAAARRIEQYLRELGHTRRTRGAYISNISLRNWEYRQKGSIVNLSKMEAENDLGEVFPLEEIAKKGVSNPEVRRAELMVRIRGCEEWAKADDGDWVPMFYTVTCPSKYHAFLADRSRPNFKYNGATPSEARDYLQTGWENARKALHRKGVECFGYRVAEPHHDGTPHWHMLIFVRRHEEAVLTDVLRRMAFREDAKEPGAKKHRFEVEEITPEKGTAVGYVAKYVSKNIDGFGMEEDEDEESGLAASDSAKRVRAWASTWNIRQFQQIGGPPVTVWRELRRLDSKMMSKLDETEREHLLAARDAADDSDWASYITAMGGVVCKRKDRPIGLHWSVETVASRVLKRVEQCAKRVKGLYLKALHSSVTTRPRTWKIRKKPSAARLPVLQFPSRENTFPEVFGSAFNEANEILRVAV